ncbi:MULTISPECIES: hypothetical protein [Rhizobium]|uniref:Lipoprotein n=1 Tax=Rhizobium rhododendri TaxID=2506430 RepID=A0ABY8IIW8_9HYPH|nr:MULTISPECIES: hypothetical protein [Rhizobium]MBO9097403.1 hypothetical protein [Rhizobium sp. L58/93]MBO9133745.1 hypothetical protein [Rhizobium sp. B209b/85]MBO9167642.1 hypothetical protein [Rhizobium sp. L245/93]MBO9183601.1 hypothetical protein [Rhizobium sp. E27B/91]MBZ5760508.1 hypothetical protein [Rhizobium sp. VS19-DR96]
MKALHRVRVGVCLAALLAGCGAMSGCMSSPTYGTDKTSGEQLFDDIADIGSISAATPKENAVKYPPRPGLVVPPANGRSTLTQPQQSLASSDNPNWVESPEDARKRLVADADANKNSATYRSPLVYSDSHANQMTQAQQTAAYREARKQQDGTYIDQRRYLIDPPAQYRQVADPAALNDLGTPESKKEKKRLKDAEAAQQTSSWWKPFQ